MKSFEEISNRFKLAVALLATCVVIGFGVLISFAFNSVRLPALWEPSPQMQTNASRAVPARRETVVSGNQPAPAEVPDASGLVGRNAMRIVPAYAYNFVKHVSWPTNTFAGSGDPIVIGVLADPLMADLIENLAFAKSVQARAVTVRRCSGVTDLAGCHLVFVRPTERARQVEILNALRHRPALTICDSESPFNLGAAIRLVERRDGTIGFWVNRSAAELAGIKLSIQLMQAADKILDQAPVSAR